MHLTNYSLIVRNSWIVARIIVHINRDLLFYSGAQVACRKYPRRHDQQQGQLAEPCDDHCSFRIGGLGLAEIRCKLH